MSTISLTWMAQQVTEQGLQQARALAQALELQIIEDDADKLMLATKRGDIIEYCGPNAELPPHLFERHSLVTGFEIDDFVEATDRLLTAGFTPLNQPVANDQVIFQHFAGPDGQLFAVICQNE